ncbi:altered inheritance of mitochondria protein 32 [Podospora fimiseda]|uniref:Altered inheritance of mitochondria protein 32 n=1 Tax=Podospora fimiseda TaxID=252190 RepID=A0AAN7BPE9_9PEZI|nr:altered inheritance of mitochondria protein 32 [Podospora fimiseda]
MKSFWGLRQTCTRPLFAVRTITTKPPSFPTIPTCPSPTCSCAPTPEFPKGFEIDHKTNINGLIPTYAQHVLICTGKDDWPSRIEDKNSGDNLAADIRELLGRGGKYNDPFHNISVLNSSFPSSPALKFRPDWQTTSVYLLPQFKYVPFLPRVEFYAVESLVRGFLLPEQLHSMHDGLSPIHRDTMMRQPEWQRMFIGVKDVEDVVVLICGHGGRDQRCGVYGPLLKGEFEKRLPEQGLEVLNGPVEVGEEDWSKVFGWLKALEEGKPDKAKRKPTARVGLISHIGGHKFAGNVIIYLPPGLKTGSGKPHPLSGHGIWYGRVEPRHVEGIVGETIRNGKVIEDFAPRLMRIRPTFSPPRNYRQLHVSIPLHRQRPPPSSRPSQSVYRIAKIDFNTFTNGTNNSIGACAILLMGAFVLLEVAGFLFPEVVGGEFPLVNEKFKPFKIVAREQISPTAFIITVEPKVRPSMMVPYKEILQRILSHGVWSVEVKQPQIQVARDYTPLPPLTKEEEDEMIKKWRLRFLIRQMPKGEVSTYISRLQVGDQIELRGLKQGFDVNTRLGECGSQVLFQAGGTGIASALQVGKVVLDEDNKRRVRITWHNRRLEDCDDGNQITKMLEEMKKRYGAEAFSYVRCVDGQGAIDAPSYDIQNMMTTKAASNSASSEECSYHSQTKLITSTAKDRLRDQNVSDYSVERWLGTSATPCLCPPGKKGKNLIMVSGPDGYVEYFAGKKIWAQGKELQGPVGGEIAKWQKKNKSLAEWLVLKF